MNESEFLYGRALSDRIRVVCSCGEVRCAVAFWGGSIRDDLFPRWEKRDVHLICDLSMNCNSRQSLMDYGAPDNDNLRVLDGLHAKVFVSAAGAVVGSANASKKGVGYTGSDANNLEAGVYFPPDSAGWLQAKDFFDDCLSRSIALDSKQLDRAPLFTSDPGRPSTLAESTDLLDIVATDPSLFGDILFVGERVQITEQDEKESNKRYKAYRKLVPDDQADRELIIRTEDDLPFRPASVIMFWRGQLIAYRSVRDIESQDAVTLWGEKGWREFWDQRSHIPGNRRPPARVSRKEKAFIRSIDDGSWTLRVDDLASRWDAFSAEWMD